MASASGLAAGNGRRTAFSEEAKMLRTILLILAAVSTIASGLPRAGAAEALKQIPADALGFAVVPRLDSTTGKLGSLGKMLGLPLPPALTGQKRLAGLSETDRSVAVALVGGPDNGKPVPVAIVPIKDFAEFTKALGAEAKSGAAEIQLPLGPIAARERRGFAFLVPADNQAVLETAFGKPASVLDRVGEDRDWIEDRDIALVITDTGLSMLCEKLSEGVAVAQQAIKQHGNDELDTAEILGVYERVFVLVDEEVEVVAIGLDLQPSGDLKLQVRKRFASAGKLAECLKASEPAGDFLAGMPDVPFVAAGGGVLNRAIADLMMQFSVEVMAAAPKLYGVSDREAARMLDVAGPILGRIQSMSMILAAGEPEDTLYSRMIVILETDNARQYLEDYRKYLEEFSVVMKGSRGVFSAEIESSPVKVGGREGLEISMAFPKQWMDQLPEGQAMLEKMIGPGGKIRAFLVPADEHRVVLGYTDTRLVDKALAVVEGKAAGLSEAESVRRAAAKLGKGSLGAGYVSPAGLIAFANGMFRAAASEGKKVVELPNFPQTPPIAWAVNAQGTAVEAEAVVPAETLKAIVGYGPLVREALAPNAP